MSIEKIQELLENCSNYEIIKTLHAKLKLHHEQVPEDEIDENLKHPKKLVQAIIERKDKHILYFKLSNSIGHKYVVEINHFEKKIKVITVVKLRIKWQKKVEKYVKQ